MFKKLLIVLFIITLCPFINIIAGSDNGKFVDLDGDGISDFKADIDNNGIPDDYQSKIASDFKPAPIKFTGFYLSEAQSDIFANLQKSEKFGLNLFFVRSLKSNRSDLESQFGGKLNFSGASGGACAGGVCF